MLDQSYICDLAKGRTTCVSGRVKRAEVETVFLLTIYDSLLTTKVETPCQKRLGKRTSNDPKLRRLYSSVRSDLFAGETDL